MITKAEIQSIDFNSNTCVVRMPYFESAAGGDRAVISALFAVSPGLYNGYKVGDIVFVAFEDGQAQQPIVVGKLFLGTVEENSTPRGAINCETLTTATSQSLPLSTKITSDTTNVVSVDGAATSYKTLKSAFDAIKANTDNIAQLKQNTGQQTITCQALLKNIACKPSETGIANYSLSAVQPGGTDWPFYYLQYNGSNNLTKDTIKRYMIYMTGHEVLPEPFGPNTANFVFTTTTGEVYYPVYNTTNTEYLNLKIFIVHED